jgi:Predicted secreted hydrolase
MPRETILREELMMRGNFKRAMLGGLMAAAAFAGFATPSAAGKAVTMSSAGDYASLGIEKGAIATFEDGMRTSGASGSYEWWYFDSKLDDGSTLVIVFYTKSMLSPNTGLKPQISLNLDRPDGTKIQKMLEFPAAQFSSSKDKCEVKIGDNLFSGDLRSYEIRVAFDDVAADIRLTGQVPAWRPETGRIAFEKGASSHYFAWLPSVPQGAVSGSITVAGKTEEVSGSGYHDHNWGDVSMLELIHDWYWGRAQVGGYTVIASYITAAEAYGSDAIPIFMLAKDGAIVADDATKVHFSAEDLHTNTKTGKPVADKVVYDYVDGDTRYRVRFDRKADLVETPFIDSVTGIKWLLAKLSGFDGAYLRFTGSVTVEKLVGAEVVDTATEDSGVWELMYFGHSPKAK